MFLHEPRILNWIRVLLIFISVLGIVSKFRFRYKKRINQLLLPVKLSKTVDFL